MIQRDASDRLRYLSQMFKVVAVIGPRQSGKTTLVRVLFPEKPYFSMENPDTRRFVLEDPRGFLKGIGSNGAILDEVQRTPDLFSYLQEVVDNSTQKGQFVLTGSNNFLFQQAISQSLAGRVAYLELLPFSVGELQSAALLQPSDDDLMFNGYYPPIYDQGIPAKDWAPNYIRTYIERDVRQVKNITDLLQFERFMRLLAGRTGQELNYAALAVEASIDVKTVQSWIGILESSFIVFLLRPHYRNFNKTLVKRPKLYFYDTGLVCSLLGISESRQIVTYPLRGAIFETMVVSELVKLRKNYGLTDSLFFWRDKGGTEIDVILDQPEFQIPIEIKSGMTAQSEFFRNLKAYNKLSYSKLSYLLYAGEQVQERSDGTILMNWRNLSAVEILKT